MTSQTFGEGLERVKQLVPIFSENEQRYLIPGHNEAEARNNFIELAILVLI